MQIIVAKNNLRSNMRKAVLHNVISKLSPKK